MVYVIQLQLLVRAGQFNFICLFNKYKGCEILQMYLISNLKILIEIISFTFNKLYHYEIKGPLVQVISSNLSQKKHSGISMYTVNSIR